MNFLATILTFLTLAVLALLSMLGTKNETLKEKIKENYDLQDANYILRKKIDDLEEKNNSLKEDINELQKELEDPEALEERLGYIRSKKEETYEEYKKKNEIRLKKEHEEYIKEAKENGKL
jgi:uncharacterized protein YlxW (UPF0749 family)